MIRVFRTIPEWLTFRDSPECRGRPLGFVPTMGALHAGHAALVQRSAEENERTLVSIFVNPTQFNDPRDLEKYPRTLEADLGILERAGASFALVPDYRELYPDDYRYRVQEEELSKLLCGGQRPGHFDGVLTVVMKLLNIAGAGRAYFGEKDYQQLLLIQGMVRAFFLPTEIVPCQTVRQEDGLALSSRNARLTPEQRNAAAAFPRLLGSTLGPQAIREALTAAGFEVDYIEERFGRRFGAVRLGEVRLIDNVEI
ncbi:MAG: pantoate--beta-alanine ligase [Oligoflexia bacterium]|nr:pantoate--beta-alanine ligase [Oligoflexia bacterium]